MLMDYAITQVCVLVDVALFCNYQCIDKIDGVTVTGRDNLVRAFNNIVCVYINDDKVIPKIDAWACVGIARWVVGQSACITSKLLYERAADV